MSNRFNDFIHKKSHSAIDFGIKPLWIPDSMFEYQKYVTELSLIRGRFADFLDTGLGKTYIALVIAQNYVMHTNKPSLIITPLAVANQFLKDAKKFGIGDIEYSKTGKWKSTTKIVICNYQRIEKFNANDFECVILDESSILKNDEGATRILVTEFMKKVKYRYLFTATPSPNDFVELGTSSEALGYLGHSDMLSRFFKNNENTISPQSIGTKWRLKGHAQESFFDWVKTWSISMRKPSDIGFSDDGYVLPNLYINKHSVKNNSNLVVNGQIMMFTMIAKSAMEVKSEQKQTIFERCEKAVELAAKHDTSVYWCNVDHESRTLHQMDKDSVEIYGKFDIDKKEGILADFENGSIKKLITKPTITGFGLNWQHCGHTVYFPDFSHEKFYQSIRRFYRFGRVDDVVCDLVYSDGMTRVIEALEAKEQKSNKLFDVLNTKTKTDYKINKKQFDQKVVLPSFLK